MPASPSPVTKKPAVAVAVPAVAVAVTKSPSFPNGPAAAPRSPKRRRAASPAPGSAPSSPGSPDSPTRKLAAARVGERSLTPYPPPLYTPRVSIGMRSVTPYPGLRRWPSREAARGTDSPSSVLSSSPDKENEPFDRSSAPSPSPSPKKKGKKEDSDVRGRSLSRSRSRSSSINSVFTFGVPTNTPRSLSRESSSSSSSASSKSSHEPVTPPMINRALMDRLLEIEVTRRCKELTELPLLDVTEAYTDHFDGIDLLCPPNTPVAIEGGRDWYVATSSLNSSATYQGVACRTIYQ